MLSNERPRPKAEPLELKKDTPAFRYATYGNQNLASDEAEIDWSNKAQQNRGQQVELIIVMAAHQPFGLLMNQVYNIVRSQGQAIKVISQPDPEQGRQWGEIEYQGGKLRVLELARMLRMPLVEPIDRSKILLSGKLLPSSTLEKPFGLAVDDILVVRQVGLDNLRLLPEWLCRKQLGKLIWGVALMDQADLEQQDGFNQVQANTWVAPLQFISHEPENNSLNQVKPEPIGQNGLLTGFTTGRAAESGKLSSPETIAYRPVVLLNLDVLKDMAYDITKW
jgi:hypothetical protein